jgi:hypothetical protein
MHVLLVKGFENLVKGEDDELKAAFAHFHKMVDEGNVAIGFANLKVGVQNLKVVGQLRKDGMELNADMKENLALAGSADQYLKGTAVFSFESLHFGF